MSERAFDSVTVLLEFEWILRGFHDFPRGEILAIPRALAGLEHIAIEDRVACLAAMEDYDAGLDFADALHVARSSRATAFCTFDRRLAKAAKAAGLELPVEALRA